MEFFSIVRDQMVNTGMEGVPDLHPRLEGWLAACDLYGIPQHSRPTLIEMARILFDGIHELISFPGLHRLPAEDLAPLALERLDG